MNNTTHTTPDGLQSSTLRAFSTLSSVATPTTTEYDYITIDDEEVNKSLCTYNSYSASFLPALYSIYFLLGFLGNGLVVWVIIKGARLRSMTDVCLFNLSLADLVLVITLPFLAHQARADWVFGDGLCKLVLGVYYVGYYSGIYFITIMGVDRYLAVVHAVYALRVRTRTYGILASVVVWITAILSSFPEVLVVKLSRQNDSEPAFCLRDYQGNNVMRAWATFKMTILGYMIPLIILIFCYSRILVRLMFIRTSKRQAVRLIVVVMVAFLCCWTPYNFSLFLWGLHVMGYFPECDSSKVLLLSLQITEVMAYTHCCLNPLLYVFVGEKFRRHLMRLLSRSPFIKCDFLKSYLTTAGAGSIYSRTTSVEERSTAL